MMVAIVNSYNRLALLKQALPSLTAALARCPFPAAVVVFDASSTDGSPEWIESNYSAAQTVPVHLISPAPGGGSSFSAGANAASRKAAALYPGCEWLLFFETDNYLAGPEPLTLAAGLLREHPELAAAGFTVTTRSGDRAGMGCSFPSVTQFLIGPHPSHWLGLDAPRLRDRGLWNGHRWWCLDAVYTSPLVVRRQAWEDTGGFDQELFPFSDCDIDWSWRLFEMGLSVAALECGGVVHDNLETPSAWSSARLEQLHRARLRLLKRHRRFPGGLWRPLLCLRHCLECAVLAVAGLLGFVDGQAARKRLRLIGSVWRDYEDGADETAASASP